MVMLQFATMGILEGTMEHLVSFEFVYVGRQLYLLQRLRPPTRLAASRNTHDNREPSLHVVRRFSN